VIEIDASIEDFLSKNKFFAASNASEWTTRANNPDEQPRATTAKNLRNRDCEKRDLQHHIFSAAVDTSIRAAGPLCNEMALRAH
jgi:hypothetical protein